MIKPDDIVDVFKDEDQKLLDEVEKYIDDMLRANRGTAVVHMWAPLTIGGRGRDVHRRIWRRVIEMYNSAGWAMLIELHGHGQVLILHPSCVMPGEAPQSSDPQPPV